MRLDQWFFVAIIAVYSGPGLIAKYFLLSKITNLKTPKLIMGDVTLNICSSIVLGFLCMPLAFALQPLSTIKCFAAAIAMAFVAASVEKNLTTTMFPLALINKKNYWLFYFTNLVCLAFWISVGFILKCFHIFK